MKNTTSAVLKVIFSSFIATLASYLARSGCLDGLQKNGIIGPQVDLEILKTALLAIGLILSLVFLSVRTINLEFENKKIVRQRGSLIKYSKKVFLNAMVECLKLHDKNIDMNIRIYMPEKGLGTRLKNKLVGIISGKYAVTEVFKAKNIEGLADNGLAEPLKFRVKPEPQWLVGECHANKELVYDSNMKKNVRSNHVLSKYIKTRISKLQFCLCIPVLDENDEVIAIISFESEQKPDIGEHNRSEWEDMFKYYCEDLVENLPDFFIKRR